MLLSVPWDSVWHSRWRKKNIKHWVAGETPSGPILFVLAMILEFTGRPCGPCAAVDQMWSLADCGAGQRSMKATDRERKRVRERAREVPYNHLFHLVFCTCVHTCSMTDGEFMLMTMTAGELLGGSEGWCVRKECVWKAWEHFFAALLSRTTKCCPPAA